MSDYKELRVAASKAEKKDDATLVGYVFRISTEWISVSEEWNGADEIYGTGISVAVPMRVWKIELSWLRENGALA